MPPTLAVIDPLSIAFQQAVVGRYSLDREVGQILVVATRDAGA